MPPSFDLSHFLPYRMTVAAERLSAGLAARYSREFGITVAEWRVLVHVHDAGEVSIREIHKQVHLEKSKASRAASRLQAAGYLTKKINPQDRRLVSLSHTDRGRALMKRLLSIAAQYQEALERQLGDDLNGLERALGILLADLEDVPGLHIGMAQDQRGL